MMLVSESHSWLVSRTLVEVFERQKMVTWARFLFSLGLLFTALVILLMELKSLSRLFLRRHVPPSLKSRGVLQSTAYMSVPPLALIFVLPASVDHLMISRSLSRLLVGVAHVMVVVVRVFRFSLGIFCS
jgi:hypothetical protein